MQAPLQSLFAAFLLGVWVAPGASSATSRDRVPMPRKLKTYQTSLGFYDLAIAAPSMKAAVEA